MVICFYIMAKENLFLAVWQASHIYTHQTVPLLQRVYMMQLVALVVVNQSFTDAL